MIKENAKIVPVHYDFKQSVIPATLKPLQITDDLALK